jgi:hypothetical protein
VVNQLNKMWSMAWQPIGNDSIRLRWNEQQLIVEAILKDADALENKKQGGDLWNGDAIEVAFAAQPELSTRPRGRFLFSDLHIGISLGEKAEAIEFRTQKPLEFERTIRPLPGGGYLVVASFQWATLDRAPWSLPGRYLLEFARDQGDAGGRKAQYRWNSVDEEGFHTTPALWGELCLPAQNSQP